MKLLSVDKNAITQVESQIEQDENIQDVAIKVSCRTIKLTYQLSDNIMISVNIKNADHFHYWLGALPYYDNVEKEGVVLAG